MTQKGKRHKSVQLVSTSSSRRLSISKESFTSTNSSIIYPHCELPPYYFDLALHKLRNQAGQEAA